MIFFEPKRGYWDKGEVDTAAGPDTWLPLNSARTVHQGSDVTLLAYGPMVRTCVEAAVAAARRPRHRGHRPALAVPLDVAAIRASVRADRQVRGRARGGGHRRLRREIAARVTEDCFYHLEAPVLRVGGFSTPYPPSKLEDHTCPTWTGYSMPSTAPSATEETAMAS